MYVVILGAGRVGTQLARQLILENKDVVLIERDSDNAKDAAGKLDCLVVNDEGNSLEGLTKAGIHKADYFVSVAASDETNLIACGLVSAEYGNITTIARVRNLDYSRTKIVSKSFLGIDYVINPEIEAAKIINYAISRGARGDIMLFENSDLQMRNLVIKQESLFKGQSLKKVRQSMDFAFLIAVILRNDKYIIPGGDTVIEAGDELYIVSSEKGFESIFRLENLHEKEIHRITIVGGGHITSYVAEEFLRQEGRSFLGNTKLGRFFRRNVGKKAKKHLQIVEKNRETCRELAERFPQALITHADVTDDSFNEEEHLQDTDLLITATNNQELNIITGIYAKTLGIPKALALVVRNSYRTMAHNLNIDMTVCLNDTMVNSILKIIRRGSIKNVHALSGGKLEVMEFQIEKNAPIKGKKISELKLPANSLIIFLSHKGQDTIPHGDTVIEEGDFIVLVLERVSVSKIEKLIAG